MSERTAIQRIDFEQWARLARHDPETFEQLRHRLLDAHIARCSSSHQQRLRRLQWRIDRLREQISNLMWTTFDQLGKAYHDPDTLQLQKNPTQAHSVDVVPFKAR